MTFTSNEKSANVDLSNTAGKSAGQSKIPFENGQVEMRFSSGAPDSGPALFLSQIESAENPIFDSPPASFESFCVGFDAKNIDDVV